MQHERFHYRTLDELKEKAKELEIQLPLAKDTKILMTPYTFGRVTLPNRVGIAPMEGADGLPDGSPSELTVNRYVREAEGGSGMIWFEAISIVPEGRSSLHQLMYQDNLDAYKKMTEAVKEAGRKANGFAPYLVMQAITAAAHSIHRGNRLR